MLAHKAEEEGLAVISMIKGHNPHLDYLSIPSVIYTHPEVAWCGYSESDLQSKNIEFNSGVFPFAANSRARANRNLSAYFVVDMDGYVKVYTAKDTDKLLGCQIIGSNAGEMISEAVISMANNVSVKQLADTCHAHPVKCLVSKLIDIIRSFQRGMLSFCG